MHRLLYFAYSLIFIAITLCIGQGCPPTPEPSAPPQLAIQRVADGFTSPVSMATTDDDRLFIVDQDGRIWIIDSDGNVLETPFIDISDQIVDLMEDFDERGLLSLTFHPDYQNNGRFFVVYNAPLDDRFDQENDSIWRLSEFTVSEADPNQAEPESEQVLLEVPKPQFNHNGGELAFGPEDGYLYVSLGDGGGANDTGFGHNSTIGNGQDLSTRLGKILRYDVSTPGTLTIPADNPFVDDDEALDAIYAYGFRNPWRFSFDSGGSHRLFVADAGQDLYEEISIVTKGGNYGWNIKEGTHCFDPDNPTMPPTDCPDTGPNGNPLIDPIIEYPHLDENNNTIGLVVIGGYIYRGADNPSLQGRYIFGDWSTSFSEPDGSIFVAAEQTDGTWTFQEADIVGSENHQLNRYVLGFGQDNEGEVYLLTTLNGGPTGETGSVFKVDTVSGQ